MAKDEPTRPDTITVSIEVDGEQLQYLYAYQERYISEIVQELLFMSAEDKLAILQQLIEANKLNPLLADLISR
jgi:hypothetical protein